MGDPEADLTTAWGDVTTALAKADPGLLATLNLPAGEQEIARLMDAVAPLHVPPDLLLYLRLANGQDQSSWWPTLDCGPLLSVDQIIAKYNFNQAGNGFAWSSHWLPLAQSGWSRAAIELVADRAALLINAELTDPPFVCAPSIASMFRATAALARTGLITRPIPPDFSKTSTDDTAAWMRGARDWRDRSRAFLSAFYAREGWEVEHIPVETPIDAPHWPAEWRDAPETTP